MHVMPRRFQYRTWREQEAYIKTILMVLVFALPLALHKAIVGMYGALARHEASWLRTIRVGDIGFFCVVKTTWGAPPRRRRSCASSPPSSPSTPSCSSWRSSATPAACRPSPLQSRQARRNSLPLPAPGPSTRPGRNPGLRCGRMGTPTAAARQPPPPASDRLGSVKPAARFQREACRQIGSIQP